MDLATAIQLVVADLRGMFTCSDDLSVADLIDRAVEISDEEITEALAGGEIDDDTAAAYVAVWQAEPHELAAVVG